MFLKLVLLEVIVLTVQCILYFGCETLQHDFHNVKRPIDDRVPLVPWTVLIYSLWFPLIAVFPLFLFYASQKIFLIYQIAILLCNLLSTICYLLWPTTFTRDPLPDTFWGRVLGFVYKASFRGVNCAPSLHCSHCFLILACVGLCPALPLLLRIVFALIAIGIILSTQLTKQHVLIDMLTALPVAAFTLALGFLAEGSGLAEQLFGWFLF